MESGSDRTVVACNYRVGTPVAAPGALAYLCQTEGSMERCQVLVRSRSGRWVLKWESLGRLHHFRTKTLPPEHPRHADRRILCAAWGASWLPHYQSITAEPYASPASRT
jgi:hypothetical protein